MWGPSFVLGWPGPPSHTAWDQGDSWDTGLKILKLEQSQANPCSLSEIRLSLCRALMLKLGLVGHPDLCSGPQGPHTHRHPLLQIRFPKKEKGIMRMRSQVYLSHTVTRPQWKWLTGAIRILAKREHPTHSSHKTPRKTQNIKSICQVSKSGIWG